MQVNSQENTNNKTNGFLNTKLLSTKPYKICSGCHGEDLRLRAVRKNRVKYYYCKGCYKSRKPIEVNKDGERMIVVCPSCNDYVIRKGISSNQKQRYYCHDCDKTTVSPKICREHIEKIEKYACINCNSTKLKKRGFDRLKNQVYFCSDCKHRSINTSIIYIDVLVKEPVDQNLEIGLNAS